MINIKTKREQMLLIVLIISLIISGYYIFRVKTLEFQLAIENEQLEVAEQEFQGTKIERLLSDKPQQLKDDIESLQLRIQHERDTLASLEETFADLSQTAAEQLVLSAITELCNSNFIRIIKIQKAKQELHEITRHHIHTKDTMDEILTRPTYVVEMTGTFASFKRFLTQLQDLSSLVVVINMNLGASLDANDAETGFLSAEFTVAI